MIDSHTLSRNRLLASLRQHDVDLLLPALSLHQCQTGKILQESGNNVTHVWFPCGESAAAFVVAADDNHVVDTALIGSEGAIGGIVSSGRLPAFARAHVQFGGPFLRMHLEALAKAKAESPSIAHCFARYSDCLVAQLFQSAACNASHTIVQRLARWLLATRDRTGSDDIAITQEQLGEMLGVGRSFINRSLRQLTHKGMLASRRRHIMITDLEKLRTTSCGCNERIRHHFDTILAGVYPTEQEILAK